MRGWGEGGGECEGVGVREWGERGRKERAIGKVVSCPDQIFLHTLRTHRKVGSGKYDERVGRYWS